MTDLRLPTPSELQKALRADRDSLRRQAARIERARAAGKPHDRNLARLLADLQRSRDLRRARAEQRPATSYPPELPISARRDEIAAAIAAHPVVIVCGETGSGKSTQLPKILLDLGFGVDGVIGHTQPRRVAARSLARRVAEELAVPLGKQVGFKVRFTDETDPLTCIKLMTDGILLAETQGDARLERYDALILDEAHERSLNVDFLLGYLKRLLARRKDLKLVVTSATIDPEPIAAFFASDGRPAPIVEVSGRTFPVEIRWRPPVPDLETGAIDELAAVAAAVDEVAREGPGDVLVFLPTERQILEAARVLRGRAIPGATGTEILPLYARLPASAQARVFEPGTRRRIVLATNVAESSVTVPGIRSVVDTGTARISRYVARSRLTRLPIEPISQAAASQRAGRCGRLGPGICVRLYAEDDFAAREAHPTPEIQRSNLAAVVLRSKALGLGSLSGFPLLDPPKRALVQEGERTLVELGALDADGRLTSVGRTLARLPTDPRIGRLLLAAHEGGCLASALIIAAALETGDVRERPDGRGEQADRSHARFASPESDLMGLLLLWDHVQRLRAGSSRSAFDAACRQQYLSASRCREWIDLHTQLRRLVAEAGLVPGRRRDDAAAIHRALAAGFLSNVAFRSGKYEYTGSDGKPLHLWPGSALFERRPRWIVAAELVETTRRYARMVAAVDPELLEEVGAPECKHSHRDPFWDERSGHVLAHEKVTLFGLPLVPKRLSRYDAVDPVRAREIFLRHALTEGVLATAAPFLEHNLGLANAVAALEAKTRKRGLLADLDVRYDFYDRRVPAEVVGASSFERWRRKVERHDPTLLFMTEQDLLGGEVGDVASEAYPDEVVMGGRALTLRYRFAPGEADDGVTLVVPVDDLDAVDEERLDWLVPGLLREKLLVLLRSLPKPLRLLLHPIPERAAEAIALLDFGRGSLAAALAAVCQRLAGEPVPLGAIDQDHLPDHLRMRIQVIGPDGRVLAEGRELQAIRMALGRQVHAAVDALADPTWHKDGLLTWDFGELPERLLLERDGRTIVAWPALVDRGASVSLRLRTRREQATRESRAGVLRLLLLSVGGRLRHRIEADGRWPSLALEFATIGNAGELRDDVAAAVVERAYLAGAPPIRDRQAFQDAQTFGASRALLALDECLARVGAVLAARREVAAALDEARAQAWAGVAAGALASVEARLSRLVRVGFVAATPWPALAELPRLLAGLRRRLLRIGQQGPLRDAELFARVAPHEAAVAALEQRAAALGSPAPETAAARWLLEELHVSVFAQELGTKVKVSDKRLAAQCEAAAAELDTLAAAAGGAEGAVDGGEDELERSRQGAGACTTRPRRR